MSFLFYATLTLFLLLSGVLSLLVLIQESKSLGFGASFGGDAGESLFGTSTASILKTITAWLGFCFLLGCVFLSIWSESISKPALTVPYSMEEVST